MTTINVQFVDSTEVAIVSYFSCPQDPAIFANQGQISTSDSRWKTYFDAQPSLAQKALPQPTAD